MTNSRIYVCPLDGVEQAVHSTNAGHLVSLINRDMMPQTPGSINDKHHLKLAMNDIDTPMRGYVVPSQAHVEELVSFVSNWDQQQSLLIHCWAGISRSTAAAFIAICALNPKRDELELAELLRKNSPSATPNKKLVENADQLLERSGKMVEAVDIIGRGEIARCGQLFSLPPLLLD